MACISSNDEQMMNYGEVWPIKTLMYRNSVSVFGRFDDFDDAIDEAIEEDIRELCDGEWTIWGIKTYKISTRSYTTHPTPSLLKSKYSHKQPFDV